jgi:hypothetical protein
MQVLCLKAPQKAAWIATSLVAVRSKGDGRRNSSARANAARERPAGYNEARGRQRDNALRGTEYGSEPVQTEERRERERW